MVRDEWDRKDMICFKGIRLVHVQWGKNHFEIESATVMKETLSLLGDLVSVEPETDVIF
jgi:hypothetical protein